MKSLAVFGNPVDHSVSPDIFAHFAKTHQLNVHYQKICPQNFEKEVLQFLEKGVGCNVTVPFKHLAFELAEVKTECATFAQAANTLFKNNQQICADTTDGVGFAKDCIIKNIPLNQKVLLIGAGGAAAGILQTLKNADLTIVNRNPKKAEVLAKKVNAKTQIENQNFDVIINATSLSLFNQLPQIDDCLYKNSICYDLVYQKTETLFMQHAQKCGAKKSFDGLGMLIEQAAKSFEIWFGFLPETDFLHQHLREKIKKK